MKIIKFIVLFIVFVALFVLCYVNTQRVTFNIPFWKSYDIVLILLLFIAFVIGSFLGILSMLSRVLHLRGKVASLKRELAKSQETVSQLMATEPATNTVVVKESVPIE